MFWILLKGYLEVMCLSSCIIHVIHKETETQRAYIGKPDHSPEKQGDLSKCCGVPGRCSGQGLGKGWVKRELLALGRRSMYSDFLSLSTSPCRLELDFLKGL